MWRMGLISLMVLTGCAGTGVDVVTPNQHDLYSVATIQKISNETDPVHVYIEGDGHAFDMLGRATDDPTPHSQFMRKMAAADDASNVVYIARPCQFIMDEKCTVTDWTDGRFSRTIVDSMADTIKTIAGTRPVVLIGYSGGAMISGLIIQNHGEIDVKKWITIAGVLNHRDWTEYFGDTPLRHSLNMNALPHLSQTHYIVENDMIVPNELSKQWVNKRDIVVIKNANHDTIPIMKLNFTN